MYVYICTSEESHTKSWIKLTTQDYINHSLLHIILVELFNIFGRVFIVITDCTEILSTSLSRSLLKCHLCSDGNDKNVGLYQSIFTLFTWIMMLVCLELSVKMHKILYLIIRLWKQLYCEHFFWFILHLYFCGLFPTMLFLSILYSTVLYG